MTTTIKYYIQYKPGDGQWHFCTPRIPYQEAGVALAVSAAKPKVNSMKKIMKYRIVKVTETVEVL